MHIKQLLEDIVKLQDEIKGKEKVIQALSDNLIEKGSEN